MGATLVCHASRSTDDALTGHKRALIAALDALQFFCAIDLAQIAVECAERQMTGLSSDFEKEAICEAKR
jgi:hypothetical protein